MAEATEKDARKTGKNARKTYNYKAEWESKKDHNGHTVGDWGSKHSVTEMRCAWFKKIFSVANGFQAVAQHSKTAGHVDVSRNIYHSLQLRMSVDPEQSVPKDSAPLASADVQPGTSAGIRLYSMKDAATTAELIWTLKCVKSNFPFASCEGISNVFRHMFPKEGAVPEEFSIGSTKATYLLTEALSLYFEEYLFQDISKEYFTLLYDETTNSANMKELELAVRYFSQSAMQVITHHLHTYFIGRATADILKDKLFEGLDYANLPRRRMLMLGSDGPRVNVKVEKLVNQDRLDLGLKPLADLGSCNIHIVHNAFLKGLEEFGMDASDFVLHTHNFFDGFPSRSEDFESVRSAHWKMVPKHDFMKHVPSRWLTLEPAVERALEQIEPLRDHILKFVPTNRPFLEKTKAYIRLRNFLKDPTLVAQLHFVASSAKIFTEFTHTRLFQRDEPLVHVIYREIEKVARTLMGRACKEDALLKIGVKEAALSSENLRPAADVICGDAAESALKEVEIKNGRTIPKLTEKERLTSRVNAQKHYVKAALHVLKNSIMKKRIAKLLMCLHPYERLSSRSRQYAVELAKSLPLDDVDTELLSDEWLLLQAEKETQPWKKEDETYIPIDKYWAQFFVMETASGQPKYPNITRVVKAALALSHGNAFVESFRNLIIR